MCVSSLKDLEKAVLIAWKMHTSKTSQNFLLNAPFDEETSKNLLRVALRLAKSGKKVLYIAAKAPESLPIEEYDDALYRDILKNITFSYSANAPHLIRFFLGMRQYQPKPAAIILDFLHTFCDDILSSLHSDQASHSRFINHHMLATATLHSAVDMFAVNSRDKFISIVCIDPNRHSVYQRFIQTYVDLYFYKERSILSFDELNTFIDAISDGKKA